MADKPTYRMFGRVTNGNLVHYNWPLFKQTLISLEGKEFDLVIKEKHKRVSLDSHSYYRAGVIKECLQYEIFGGWDFEDIHSFFANMFLKDVRIRFSKQENGESTQYAIPVTRSTADLNQRQMNEFVEKVIAWLSNQGVVIHSPEEYYLSKYKTVETNGNNEKS